LHSPLHDNDDEGDDDEAPPAVFEEGQPLHHDPYQDAGSLANALSPNPRQHIPQQIQYGTTLPANNNSMTMQSSYPTIQQMHPPSQTSMHFSNGLYHGADEVSDSEIRRRTEEMIHFGGSGASSGGS